jgi:hypothetical protein
MGDSGENISGPKAIGRRVSKCLRHPITLTPIGLTYRLNNLAACQLLVGVGWVDDLLLCIVDDSESREAVSGSELPAPARADGISTTDVAAGVGLSGWAALDLEGARSVLDGIIDTKSPGADTASLYCCQCVDQVRRVRKHVRRHASCW